MADEVATTETTETTTEPEVEAGKTDEPLGDAGKKALEAERAARKAAEEERKALAAKLKEIEDRDKTEAEKAAERLAEAEKRAAEVEARATRAEVAAATSIPVEILAGPKSSSVEDVTAFAELVTTHFASQKPQGPVIPGQGKQPEKTAETTDDWFRSLASGH